MRGENLILPAADGSRHPCEEDERAFWMQQLTKSTDTACGILLDRAHSATMPGWAKRMRLNANYYIYAAMCFDFLRVAESQILLTDGIDMQDGTIKTVREFMCDEIIEGLFRKLEQQHRGREFVSGIRAKFAVLLQQAGRLPGAAGNSTETNG